MSSSGPWEIRSCRTPYNVALLRSLLRCGRMLSFRHLHMIGVSILLPTLVLVWHLSVGPLVRHVGGAHKALSRVQREREMLDQARLKLAHTQGVVRQIYRDVEESYGSELTSKTAVVQRCEELAAHAKATLRSVEHQRDLPNQEDRFVVVFEGRFEGIIGVLRQCEDRLRGMLLIDTELTTETGDHNRIELKVVLRSPVSNRHTFRCR